MYHDYDQVEIPCGCKISVNNGSFYYNATDAKSNYFTDWNDERLSEYASTQEVASHIEETHLRSNGRLVDVKRGCVKATRKFIADNDLEGV